MENMDVGCMDTKPLDLVWKTCSVSLLTGLNASAMARLGYNPETMIHLIRFKSAEEILSTSDFPIRSLTSCLIENSRSFKVKSNLGGGRVKFKLISKIRVRMISNHGCVLPSSDSTVPSAS